MMPRKLLARDRQEEGSGRVGINRNGLDNIRYSTPYHKLPSVAEVPVVITRAHSQKVHSFPLASSLSPLQSSTKGCRHTSSSSITQSSHLLSPKLMHPKIGTETFRPHLPSCLYAVLEWAIDSASRGGSSFLSVILANVCLVEEREREREQSVW